MVYTVEDPKAFLKITFAATEAVSRTAGYQPPGSGRWVLSTSEANWSSKNYTFGLGCIKNICLVCFRRTFCEKKNESARFYLIQEWVVQSNAKKVGGDNAALASRLSRYPNMFFKFNFLGFL